MRQFRITLCAVVASCGFVASAGAVTPPPLTFTLDLLAPCSGGTCTGIHSTDVNLQVQAADFSYAQDASLAGNPFVATLTVKAPMVCDEIASSGVGGASSSQRLAPKFTNDAPGGLLEFNAGGPTIVDLGSVMYDGTIPAGVAGTYSNQAAPQVTCYQINPVTGGPTALAVGPNGIFVDHFEDRHAHFGDEPWVSVQTVNSPSAQAGSGKPGSSQPNTAPLNNQLVYVLQIHNANSALGWRLNLGYDAAFFDPASNGMVAPQWCVLPPVTSPQPGALQACGSGGTTSTSYTVSSNDVQSDSDSVYLQVLLTGSNAAVGAWGSLSGANYPATASVFPKFGIYPERFDDKSAVVSSNNQPVLNVGSIVCNNDTVSTSCAIADQDGKPIIGGVQGQLTTTSSITSGGSVTVNPLAYFVDLNGGTTLPGSASSDIMSVSNVSCSDPSSILTSPMAASNFSAVNGLEKLVFSFAASGGLYVPGTATCMATFTTPVGFSPQLSSTRSFTIAMGEATTSRFSVTAPGSTTAGVAMTNVVVTALDATSNPVASYNGTVTISSSDPAMVPFNATLSNGVATVSVTLKTAGSQSITATDTATSSITGSSTGTTVSPGPATQYQLFVPSSATHGVQTSFFVTALDAYGNTATGYGGTVHFAASDPLAALPADATLLGTTSFNITFGTSGPQTITATDTVNSLLTKMSGSITVN